MQGILSRNSGGFTTIKKELGLVERIKLLDGIIFHVEGKDYFYPIYQSGISLNT